LTVGVLAATLIAAAPSPARAAKPRIAVIGLSMGDVTAEVRIKINAAVVGGLIASGADVADSTATGRAMAERGMVACDTATCLTEIGKATGAPYLMRGSMEMTGRSYIIRLEMIDASTAIVIDTREDRCEICTENEAYETASVSASALKSQVFRRRVTAGGGSGSAATSTSTPTAMPTPTATAAAGPRPAAGTTSAVAPLITQAAAQSPNEPPVLVDTPGAPETPSRAPRTGPGALAWITGVGGVAAIGAGISLVAIDNGGVCMSAASCTPHKTKTGGLILTGVGFAAAVASVLAFTGRF